MALEFAKALTSQIKNPTLNKAANASLNALGRVSSAYGSLKNMASGAKSAYQSASAPVQSALKTSALSTVLPLPIASAISTATTKKPAPAQTPGFTPASQSMLDALKRQQPAAPATQLGAPTYSPTSTFQEPAPTFSAATSGSTTSATSPTQPQTSTPTTPAVSPEMKAFLAQRQALMGQISGAMMPTAEELATSQKLQDLQAQQANIAASEQLGLNKIEDQPIAMNFITGQQAALQRQASAQSGALQAQQVPLQTQLAMIQAERQRKADIAKAQLESDTPIEVGGNLVNPVTGEVVYSGAKNAEGFTLGEGQQRYDAAGNLLASVAKSPDSLTPYQAAQLEIENRKLAQGKQLTPDQINRISEGKQLPIVLEGLEKAIKENSMVFGPAAGRVFGAIPYATETQTIQAELKRAMQSIGKYLEGGVLRAEDEKKYEKMLPQLTDTPQVALNKLAGIKTLLENKQAQYLSDIGSGGYNQSNFGSQVDEERAYLQQQNYSQEDIDRLLGKTNDLSTSQNGSIKLGSNLARQNNNPGNLRFVGQPGASQGAGGFARFETPQAGVQALKNQIKLDASRGHTLQSFISKYAPPTENDTALYIQQLSQRLGVSPQTSVSTINLDALTREIMKKESSSTIG